VEIGRSSVPVASYPRIPGVPAVTVQRLRGHLADGSRLGPVPHTHDFLLLLYAVRAAGTVLVDGRGWRIAGGDLFLIAPGQVVSPTGADDPAVTDAWGVYFPPDVIRSGVPSAFSSWLAHPLLFPFARGAAERAQRLRVPPAERPDWLRRFEALDAELRERRDGYHAAVLAQLTLLLVAVSRLSADIVGELRSVDEPVLAAVFDVIEARYAEPISLADVAAELGLSGGHLTTVVRRRTGRTVQQWIGERRMQEARRLLADTDLPVAAVGRRVGYPDAGYFIRRFHRAHGTTPLPWRRAGRAAS
jgi:AraC family transcriptional regulator, transcriptional activator of pobA